MRILLSALVTLRWTASVFAAMSLHPAIPFSFIQETMLLPAPPRPTTQTFGRAAVTAPANLSASDRSWDAESLSMAFVDIGKVRHRAFSQRLARSKTDPRNLQSSPSLALIEKAPIQRGSPILKSGGLDWKGGRTIIRLSLRPSVPEAPWSATLQDR